LNAIHHSEERVTGGTGMLPFTTPRYEYTLSDHLGYGRVYYTDANGDGIITASDILQDNDPRRNTGGVGVNLYQYNGKELIQDAGLGWHAYGKRYYDAAIGRFPNVDPLIDTFHFVTGYNYAENEPVGHIDLWGLQKVSFQANITQGAVGADARLLGLKAGAVATLDGRNLLGFDASYDLSDGKGTLNGNAAENEHKIGLSGGLIAGGEISHVKSEETGKSITEAKAEPGGFNIKYIKETDKDGNVTETKTIGFSFGIEAGIGIIGIKIELNFDIPLEFPK
jgi:RHS repeat-associated protein